MSTPTIEWFEVLGQDQAALQKFYADTFGWTFERIETPVGPYGITDCDQAGIPGGVGTAAQGPGWTTFYVRVDNLEAYLEKATANGGKVLVPPMSLPDTRIAVFADPEGHPIGLSQPHAA